jgi:predicted nucleic acid-binding protein
LRVLLLCHGRRGRRRTSPAPGGDQPGRGQRHRQPAGRSHGPHRSYDRCRGELTKWTLIRRWGPSRLAELEEFLADVIVLPYSRRVATTWGDLQAHAQLRGRPRPANDTWVAACCLIRNLPLLAFNQKDFEDFSDHEGLVLLPIRE